MRRGEGPALEQEVEILEPSCLALVTDDIGVKDMGLEGKGGPAIHPWG